MRPSPNKRFVTDRTPTVKQRRGESNERSSPSQERQEWLLDEALMETFPASDPISPAGPRADAGRPDAPSHASGPTNVPRP